MTGFFATDFTASERRLGDLIGSLLWLAAFAGLASLLAWSTT